MLSKPKNKYPDFKYIDILNSQLQSFQFKFTERLENRLSKYLLLLDQTILLQFRSSIDRPLNLPQYPGSNNYFSIPEENIKSIIEGL
jgi:hypothetical protein